jgi:hypothetical protein
VIRVVPSSALRPSVEIESIRCVGLRCNIVVTGAGGLLADLRCKAADPASSVAVAQKTVDSEGKVSLLVEDEDLIGSAAIIVLYDPDNPGKPLAQDSTIIGGTGNDS